MMYHEPVLLQESVNGLVVNPDGIYIDVTFGGGGHAREILNRLKNGRLVAFDQDKNAENNVTDDSRFTFLRQNFKYLKNNLRFLNIQKVDGILADLGVSSYQFDHEERGFSFRFDGTLDMRMNQDADIKASDIINNYSREDLIQIFRQYGELKNAVHLVDRIMENRESIEETSEFLRIIEPCIPRKNRNKYLAQVFQALRIEVNKEISNLKEFLWQTVELVKNKGRLVIISYHSLEDRVVKNFPIS
jgi:16S rRNA (cytosine1402-N4)-methyltransferase